MGLAADEPLLRHREDRGVQSPSFLLAVDSDPTVVTLVLVVALRALDSRSFPHIGFLGGILRHHAAAVKMSGKAARLQFCK